MENKSALMASWSRNNAWNNAFSNIFKRLCSNWSVSFEGKRKYIRKWKQMASYSDLNSIWEGILHEIIRYDIPTEYSQVGIIVKSFSNFVQCNIVIDY